MSETFDPGNAKDPKAAELEEARRFWQEELAATAMRITHQAELDSAAIISGRTSRQLVWLTVAILVVTVATLGVGIAALARTEETAGTR